MAEKIQMIALSPTMEEGTIAAWQKQEGDEVSSGDVLCEVETDKATMDYEATQEGTLLKILLSEGEGAEVGRTIAIIGEEGEDIGALLQEAQQEEAGKAESGRQPAAREQAPSAGVAAQQTKSAAAADEGHIKSSPLARKLAEQKNIDLAMVTGSGPEGRIVKRDIESFSGPAAPAAGTQGAGAQGAGTPAGQDRRVELTAKRKVIAQRLSESKFSAPHYYVKNSVRMDAVLAARSSLNSGREHRVSLNAFLIKFSAEALKRHPRVNASWRGDHIVEFGSIDIGLAVDLGNGLITPVIRNCGAKGIIGIDEELKALIEKTRKGKLVPEEYSNAGFSISNLGSFGVEEFTAVINPPGSAILALGEINKTPLFGPDGELSAAQLLKMTLSCDHRVIDGAEGAAFMKDLKDLIESPVKTLY
jgi:pyruvate dehydrogenase E2 component (dihydrolipoamide acetyltransferase)